ncbi:MAG: alpha/beta fold hydrolase [Dehalococcoidia bacterium]
MSWFEHGEARVYYEESGAGAPLLLLPGWAGSIDELAPIRAALEGRYRVIAADLPGSGKSAPQPRTFTPQYLEEDAKTFLALLDELRAAPAHLVGFSDGGEYALLMAATRPEVARSVVTWGAAGSLGTNTQMADAMTTLIDDPIPPMAGFAEFLKAAYGEDNARIMTRSAGQAFRAIMDTGGDVSRSRAERITAPALLITGEHDFLATPDLVADMAAAIPNGTFVKAADASHPVHHEQSEWLTRTIAGWLSERS